MNKQVVIGVGIILVLAGGYFAYSKMGSKSSDGLTVTNPYMEDRSSSSVDSTNPSGKKMAFDVFVRQGGSYVCTVHQNVNNVDSVGTMYVANGNMRGEFDTTVGGTKMTSSMIMKDGYIYSWSSAAPTMGFKIAVGATAGAGAGVGNSYGYDANQFGDYDCEPWSGDSSKFTPPTSVKFTEMKQ